MWGAVRLELPVELEDELGALLATEGLGLELRPGTAGRSQLRVYFDDFEQARAVRPLLHRILERHGLDPLACNSQLEQVVDGRWVERYQQALQPFELGRRFLVDPGCGVPPGQARTVLRLVPGRAFGTGEHPTTRLCVEALERHVRAGSRWLDIGSGSGILSLVARAAGAEVLALDDDPEAVEVSREVLRANAVEQGIRVELGTLRHATGAWDGIVGNIASGFFLEHAAAVAERIRPQGLLIASGFLVEESDELDRALLAVGLARLEHRAACEWGCTSYRRLAGA